MCLPVAFLKTYNSVGPALTILVSLFGIIYSLILVLNDKGKIGIQNNNRDKICWALFGSSFILLFFAILALVGIMKRKVVLTMMYNVTLLFAMITYFGIAIAGSTVPFKVLNNACSSSSAPSWSQNMTAVSNYINTTFCQIQCPCSIASTVFNNYPNAYKQNLYAYLPYMSNNNTKLAQSAFQCPGQQNNDEQQQAYQNLQQLQQTFGCAGWCNLTLTYGLTTQKNVLANPPTKTCFAALTDYYHEWGIKLVWGSWIIFFIIMVNSIFVLCYVFHPQKRAASMYQRLSG